MRVAAGRGSVSGNLEVSVELLCVELGVRLAIYDDEAGGIPHVISCLTLHMQVPSAVRHKWSGVWHTLVEEGGVEATGALLAHFRPGFLVWPCISLG